MFDFCSYCKLNWFSDCVLYNNLFNNIFFQVPPPGSGVLLGFIFNILRGYDMDESDVKDTPSRILTMHRIVETFKHAYAKRSQLGDSDFVDIREVNEITSVLSFYPSSCNVLLIIILSLY